MSYKTMRHSYLKVKGVSYQELNKRLTYIENQVYGTLKAKINMVQQKDQKGLDYKFVFPFNSKLEKESSLSVDETSAILESVRKYVY